MIVAQIIVLLVIATLPHAMGLFWYLAGQEQVEDLRADDL